MNSNEVLLPSWLQEYEKSQQALWGELVSLSTNLAILRTLADFPFNLLFAPNDITFWNRTRFALWESSIMIVWRIGVDTAHDALTIRSFKNKVMRNFLSTSDGEKMNKEQIQKALKRLKFDKKLESVKETVVALRHNFIAHYVYDHATGISENRIGPLPLEKLEEMRDWITEIFHVLSFDRYHLMLPVDYSPDVTVGGQSVERDIDKLLLQVASRSFYVNCPEKNPNAWPRLRKDLSPTEIESINGFRNRLDLSPA